MNYIACLIRSCGFDLHFILNWLFFQEENDKVREQEREIESKKLAEAESKVMHEKLQMEHEKNMKIMTDAVSLNTFL